MEEKNRLFSSSEYEKMKNNPLISKEMLSFVRKKIIENKKQNIVLTEESVETIKKFSPKLIANVIKKLLEE
ncbi:MAG: hypothetical protein N2053_06635 [Chitinispirillaceae bacterium]|nr:hypothetical protein [Chitinispirillaceae bacterium]